MYGDCLTVSLEFHRAVVRARGCLVSGITESAIRRGVRWGFALASLILALGCSDSNGPGERSVAGDWRGSFTDAGITVTIDLDLAQSGQTVSGTALATFSVAQLPPQSYPVTGTYAAPQVALTLEQTGADAVFTGTVSGNSMTGTLTDGQSATALTFTRQ